jgi:hypothetical protein
MAESHEGNDFDAGLSLVSLGLNGGSGARPGWSFPGVTAGRVWAEPQVGSYVLPASRDNQATWAR